MEILRKYFFASLLIGITISCADSLEEDNVELLSGDWEIMEIYVDLDIPPTLIEAGSEATPREFAISDDLHILQVIYSQDDGISANGTDLSSDFDLDDSYNIVLQDNGLYSLAAQDEFIGLNIMEVMFQYMTPYVLSEEFPDFQDNVDYPNGDYDYYQEVYRFSLEYEYFSSDFTGGVPEGIWETVGKGEQILFDYTHPLYEQGSNLWDIEFRDENTVVLTQFGESEPTLSLSYMEEREYLLSGESGNYQVSIDFNNKATINNSSIILQRK